MGNAAALISPDDRVVKAAISAFDVASITTVFAKAAAADRPSVRLSARPPIAGGDAHREAPGMRPVLRGPLRQRADVSTRSSLKIMESILEAVSRDASGSSILTARLGAPR